jgi:hypothetical protein
MNVTSTYNIFKYNEYYKNYNYNKYYKTYLNIILYIYII